MERIQHVGRLLAGDCEAMQSTVCAEIEGLDFPFDTQCTVGIDKSDHVMIDLDLPEIEDVIPELQFTALKNGTMREVKRKEVDRNEAYATLVTGIAFTIAGAAFAGAPTLLFATVAARTQRQIRGSIDVVDTYVYEVRFPRDAFESIDAPNLDPLSMLCAFPCRIQVTPRKMLKKLSPPDWHLNPETVSM
jgi:hypothetical protein